MDLAAAQLRANTANQTLPEIYLGQLVYVPIAVMDTNNSPFYTADVLLVPVSRKTQVEISAFPVGTLTVFKGMRARKAYGRWIAQQSQTPYPNTAAAVAGYVAFFDDEIKQITA